MELRDIRYFLALCEELHFTRAAERCGVSQPCISAAIKKIEAELGGVLFHRRPQPQLSELGRAVRPLLEGALRNIEHSVALAHGQGSVAQCRPAPSASLADVREAMQRIAAEVADAPAEFDGDDRDQIVLARLRDSRVVSSYRRAANRREWRTRMWRFLYAFQPSTGSSLAVVAVGLVAVAITGLLFIGVPTGKPDAVHAATPEITSSTPALGAAPRQE
jgi:hypothetical protein